MQFEYEPDGEVPIASEGEIVVARKCVRDLSKALDFSITEVTRMVTAASELARNIQRYANRGVMYWQVVEKAGMVGLELRFVDEGPGIEDIDKAMQEGYSSSRSLGMGLPGTKRLVDEMEVDSVQGQGTTVVIRKWISRR
ncbi:MAG: anti-sigma regulatory factor [Sedimenticola sp.]